MPCFIYLNCEYCGNFQTSTLRLTNTWKRERNALYQLEWLLSDARHFPNPRSNRDSSSTKVRNRGSPQSKNTSSVFFLVASPGAASAPPSYYHRRLRGVSRVPGMEHTSKYPKEVLHHQLCSRLLPEGKASTRSEPSSRIPGAVTPRR